MHASTAPAWRLRGRTPVSLLLVLVLGAACGSEVPATPVPTTPVVPELPPASASPTPSPAVTAAPVEPTASPAPEDATSLIPGALAVTITDDLRVRSQPRVADDSLRYTPTLREGTSLVVIAGPLRASGYTWLKVAPVGVELMGGAKSNPVPVDQGWVAIADRDGTPWVAPADDPTPGYALASATVERARPTLAAARRAASAQNAFGLDLYRRMLADPALGLEDKGVVMSPTSIAMALGMARAGAEGDTAAEMDEVLRFDGWESAAGGLGALDQELRSRDATWSACEDCGSHSLALRMANQVFGQEGHPIRPEFLERVGATFGSPLALVDYIRDAGAARDAINGWVGLQTLGRIPALLGPADVTSDTRLVLVNAVYFKSEWELTFASGLTSDRPFTTIAGDLVTVPTMRHVEATLPVASGRGWRATELRYLGPAGPDLSMTLVLPDDMATFEQRLRPALIAAIDAQLDAEWDNVSDVRFGDPDPNTLDCGTVDYVTSLSMPRFGIETRADLVPALERAGMRRAMSPEADFSGMSAEHLEIGMVVHQANIDVDEEGTEASAATAVGMDTGGGCGGTPVPDEVRTLELDRPFLFLLRDTRTGAILFLGRVADPSVR